MYRQFNAHRISTFIKLIFDSSLKRELTEAEKQLACENCLLADWQRRIVFEVPASCLTINEVTSKIQKDHEIPVEVCLQDDSGFLIPPHSSVEVLGQLTQEKSWRTFHVVPKRPTSRLARNCQCLITGQVNREANAVGMGNPIAAADSKAESKRKKFDENIVYYCDPLVKAYPTRVAGTVYMFGMGIIGQLGIEAEKRKYPALVPALPKSGVEVAEVQCGGMHTVVLLKDGSVWTFGNNDDLALGRDTPEEHDMRMPGKVELNEFVIQVTAGDMHSAALTQKGKVYIWGNFRDSNGKMGLLPGSKHKGKCVPKPVQLTLFKNMGERIEAKITKIASGSNHLVMLADYGRVYTCGSGEQGQLGRERLQSSSGRVLLRSALTGNDFFLTALQVSTIGAGTEEVVDIWTGEFSTYLKVRSGSIWVCGLNNFGQLGLKAAGINEDPTIHVPVMSPGFSDRNWIQIAAGEHHAIALDDAGIVHALGRNEDGRLGLGSDYDNQRSIWSATAIPKLRKIPCILVACGLSTSYAISKDKNQLYAWGFGENFQLASGNDDDQAEPNRCKFSKDEDKCENIVYVSAGAQHVGIIKGQSKVKPREEVNPFPRATTLKERN